MRGRGLRRGLLALTLLVAACGGDEAEQTNDLAERRNLINALTAEDGAQALEEADAFVRDDLPVRAGDVIESRVLPALARQREALDGVRAPSEQGRARIERAVQVVDERIAALETYRRVLARGLVEDFTFVQASSAHRVAEENYAAMLDELAGVDENREEEEEAPE